MSNPGENPSPVRCVEIAVTLYCNRDSVKKEIILFQNPYKPDPIKGCPTMITSARSCRYFFYAHHFSLYLFICLFSGTEYSVSLPKAGPS